MDLNTISTFLGNYLYFFGSLIGFLIVLIIYYKRPALRHEMFISGTLVAIAGVFSEYIFFKDYWMPPLIIRFGPFGGIEDLLFGFVAGSLGSILFNWIFKKSEIKKYKKQQWFILFLSVSVILSILIFTYIFHVNSIFASCIGLLVPVTIVAFIRKDLIPDIIFSAIACGIILVGLEGLGVTLFHDYLQKYYLLYNQAPIILGVFPLTEFIWGISFGAVTGPFYEFYNGLILVNNRKSK